VLRREVAASLFWAGALLWTDVLGPGSSALAQPGGPLVFAAASLKNAMEEIAASWAKERKAVVKLSLAGSNTLARQIEAGAPADLFVSADLDWMDHLQTVGLIRKGTRVNLLGNTLVIIAPKDAAVTVTMGPKPDLTKALGSGRLAMGDVNDVNAAPSGKYGKAALEKLGAWEGVKDKIVPAEDARSALLYVSRGEAPLGIVYATDAAADPNVKIVATFPANSHPPIVYPVAITQASTNPDAAAFFAYLRGPAAKAAFERQGFSVPNQPVTDAW
jgi:molybdate transport system substrate-binding protein